MDKTQLPNKYSKGEDKDDELRNFSSLLKQLSKEIGFQVSARGWCYILENAGMITKADFKSVNTWINKSVKKGYLDVDFVAEDSARSFSVVETPSSYTPLEYFKEVIKNDINLHKYYDIDWWDNEKYYIQMVVEKIDLKTLFLPICEQYHIPIANARGWSSILQRAEFAKRFKEAEERGLKPVLLYCGDHDPDGLRISDTLKENLNQISDITWSDGTEGYDPQSLIIDRFGLNYDFIKDHNLSFIDNLLTGSGKNLASPSHRNNHLQYVQNYLNLYGARKWEANALVVAPQAGRELCKQSITKYLGDDALQRFEDKKENIKNTFEKYYKKSSLYDIIDGLDDIDDEEED